MYKVKATDPHGQPVTVACGTAEQAVEKALELEARGFRDVMVTDLKGQVRSAAKFARMFEG